MDINDLPLQEQQATAQVTYDLGKPYRFAEARDRLIACFAKVGITAHRAGAAENDGPHLKMLLAKPSAGTNAKIEFSVVYGRGDGAISNPVAELTRSDSATHITLNTGSGVFDVLEDMMKKLGAQESHADIASPQRPESATRTQKLLQGEARTAYDDSIRNREFNALRSIKAREQAKLQPREMPRPRPRVEPLHSDSGLRYEPASHQFGCLMERMEDLQARANGHVGDSSSSGQGKKTLGEMPVDYKDYLKDHSLHELELELVQKVHESIILGSSAHPQQQVQTADEIRFLTLYVLNRRFDEMKGKISDSPQR